jgi:putative ABC transport system permease protein
MIGVHLRPSAVSCLSGHESVGRLQYNRPAMNLSFFLETFRLGVNNLHLHKLRSFLTTLGIIFGVLSVITMVAIGEGGKRQTLKAVEQLGSTNIILRSVQPRESNQSASRRDFQLIYGLKRGDFTDIMQQVTDGQLPSVRKIVPLRDAGLDVVRDENKANAAAIGTTPDFLGVANLSINSGRFFDDDDMANKRPVCVLGSGAAQQLFGPSSPIGQTIRLQSANIRARLFEVIGVTNAVGLAGGKGSALTGRDLNFDVYFPLTANEGMFGDTIVKFSSGSRERKVLQLSEIYIKVASPDAVEPTAAALQRMMDLRHSEGDVRVFVPRELLNQANATQRLFNFIMVGIAFLSLLVGGIGIMNISLATVTERTREIGIRRALGGKRAHIVTQFLIETTCLSVSGGLVGVTVGLAVSTAIDMLSSRYWDNSFPAHVTLWSVVLSFAISAGVGIIFGLYPAIVAAHKDPIEALRHD